jgi:hypothetical protein
LQELQFPELQDEQVLPLVNGWGIPFSPDDIAKQTDITLSDLFLHFGHSALSPDRLKGLNNSNLLRHLLHTYS